MVLSLSVALVIQISQRPRWFVAGYSDLRSAHSTYGRAATIGIAKDLDKLGTYDVVANEQTDLLGGSIEESQHAAMSLRANAFVQGVIVDHRTMRIKGGRRTQIALRTAVYETASGEPVNGSMEKGEAESSGRHVGDVALVDEALEQALDLTMRTLRAQTVPTATILSTSTRALLIDLGARAGFEFGARVILSWGNIMIARGHIVKVEPNQAEVALEGVVVGLAPGDRVRQVIPLPTLPPKGASVFKYGCRGIAVRHPRFLWRWR